ncbi:response regulator transcription factor [Micromonospora sp. NPDC005174]|uniref:response regulator transcription factor n=1 Tax=unclassified Micromonospora TaxID=2617518 RepID=UPI0033A66179
MSTLDVAVVSPSDVARAGLVRLVSNLPGLEVSLELASVARLLALPTSPPLAIVDITGLRRASVHGHLWSVLPRRTRVVLVCRPDVRLSLPDALRAGVRAMILADDAERDLRTATETAALDSVYISPGLVEAVCGHLSSNPVRLAEREIKVLRLVASGLSNVMIGEQMGVTESTVGTYLKRIRTKLNAANKAELTRRAIELGYVSPHR